MSKVMVSLSEDLLRRIDTEARRRSTTRSGFLAVAAHRELSRRDPAAVREAIERSERRFKQAPAFEAADMVRHDRDARA